MRASFCSYNVSQLYTVAGSSKPEYLLSPSRGESQPSPTAKHWAPILDPKATTQPALVGTMARPLGDPLLWSGSQLALPGYHWTLRPLALIAPPRPLPARQLVRITNPMCPTPGKPVSPRWLSLYPGALGFVAPPQTGGFLVPRPLLPPTHVWHCCRHLPVPLFLTGALR